MSGTSEHFAYPSTELRSTSPGQTGQYDQLFPGAWEIAQGGMATEILDKLLVSRITLVLASVYPSAKLVNVKTPLCSLLR